MNSRFFTGYLNKDAAVAYTPQGVKRLLFDVVIKDSRGEVFPDKCLIDDQALIEKNELQLTSGRTVIIEGEQTSHPFMKGGVVSGYVRECRVLKLEIPARSAVTKPEPAAEERES